MKYFQNLLLLGINISTILLGQSIEIPHKMMNKNDAINVPIFIYDVSNLESFMDTVSQEVEMWDTVDILINNAGITRDNIIMRLKEEDWDTVIDINLKGCFNVIKAVTRPKT